MCGIIKLYEIEKPQPHCSGTTHQNPQDEEHDETKEYTTLTEILPNHVLMKVKFF